MKPGQPIRPIQRLDLFCDAGRLSQELLQRLTPHFDVRAGGIEGIRGRRPGPTTIFDIDVNDAVRSCLLKR